MKRECNFKVKYKAFFIISKELQKANKTSSNINEVIRAVLNFLLFFYEKISHAQKTTKKHKKHKKPPKRTKSTKTRPNKSTKAQISEQK